jgi:hypothetical protein
VLAYAKSINSSLSLHNYLHSASLARYKIGDKDENDIFIYLVKDMQVPLSTHVLNILFFIFVYWLQLTTYSWLLVSYFYVHTTYYYLLLTDYWLLITDYWLLIADYCPLITDHLSLINQKKFFYTFKNIAIENKRGTTMQELVEENLQLTNEQSISAAVTARNRQCLDLGGHCIYGIYGSTGFSPLSPLALASLCSSCLLLTAFLASRFSLRASRLSLLDYRFSLLTSRFSLLASRFSLLASRFSLLASHFLLLYSCSHCLTSHF